MLKFYGIRFNQNGNPERFSVSYALSESLHAGLTLSESMDCDPIKTVKAVDLEIEGLFCRPEAKKNGKLFRFQVAKWFRTKDIIQFLFAEKQTEGLKLEIARILCTGEGIEKKWKRIEALLLGYLGRLSQDVRNDQLSNPESDLNLILQMISLLFLEQDEELPPANLELQFIRNQFPRIIWKKKDGFNASSNPFWLPGNCFCRSSYLQALLLTEIHKKTSDSSEPLTSPAVRINTGISTESAIPVPTGVTLSSLLPEEPPHELRIILDDESDDNQQLELIPETASETLLSLQKLIQRKLSHEGVKHFFGILRQFAGATPDGYCVFNTQEHLSLVARVSKGGRFTDRQTGLFNEVFELISRVRVKRSWTQPGHEKETVNPFVLVLYTECTDQTGYPHLRHTVLDPLLLPVNNNPFFLGGHLRLIPEPVFRESAKKHALLPGIASYLTGTWLNEYFVHRGTTTKSTREIIEGCAFNLTPANRYRIMDKVKSELAYMKEKCYISEYRHQASEDGNPWDDLHCVTASEAVLADLADKMRAVDANSISERLIA